MKTVYYIVLLLFLITGGWLYSSSFNYNWYTVSEKKLWELSSRLADKPRNERWREWYIEIKKLETPRKKLHDIGIGTIGLVLILIVFYFKYGFPLGKSTTPKAKKGFIVLYILALALQVPFAMYYYEHRLIRFEYPTWGDSIMIGVFQTGFFCIMFGGIGLFIFLVVLKRTLFPADIYIWSKSNSFFCYIITVVTAIFALFILTGVFGSVRSGDIGSLIMEITMLYLIMSFRAGMINFRMNKVVAADQGIMD